MARKRKGNDGKKRSEKSEKEKILEGRKKNPERRSSALEKQEKAFDRIRKLKRKEMKKKARERVEKVSNKKVKEGKTVDKAEVQEDISQLISAFFLFQGERAEELQKRKQQGERVRWKQEGEATAQNELEEMINTISKMESFSIDKKVQELQELKEELSITLEALENISISEFSEMIGREKLNQDQVESYLKGIRKCIEENQGKIEQKIEQKKKTLSGELEVPELNKSKTTSKEAEKKTKTQQDQGGPPNTKFMKKLEMVEKGVIDESEEQIEVKKTLKTRGDSLKEEEIEKSEEVIGVPQTYSLLYTLSQERELSEEEKKKMKELKDKLY